MADAPERIFAAQYGNTIAAELDHRSIDGDGAEYIRADLHAAEVARLTAERDAAIAGAVTVKPLEWHKSHFTSWRGDWHTVPTNYTVRCADENGWRWSHSGGFGYCHSDEAAKAAAQADYERRVRSAITPAPPQEP